jgi:regulator of protease activity HflC (stomatin/prohibitin superfamily)
MLYRVVDLRRSVYEVDDLAQAVSDTAQSQLKRIFGGLTFTEVWQRRRARVLLPLMHPCARV